MQESEAVFYTHPETGERLELDPVQVRNYQELVSQGLFPEDAAVVAYLMDSVDTDQPTIDWARLLMSPAPASKIVGLSRQYITTLSKQIDHPEWRACFTQSLGGRLFVRMFSIGRLQWIVEGTPPA